MNVSLYQSFYKSEQRELLSPYCYGYDNIANPNPDLREYPQMKDVHEKHRNSNDIYGLISWKFKQKALIDPAVFKTWIETNPGYDFYFINPCFILEAICINPWEQGEWHHKGIAKMGDDGLGIPVSTWVYPNDKTMYANYFVGNTKFWSRMIKFVDDYFLKADQNPDLKQRIYSPARYATDSKITNFIFLFERLVPTFLLMHNDISTLRYPYTFENVRFKMNNRIIFDEINSLSELKTAASRFNSQPILGQWRYQRNCFLEKYKGIENLE